MIFSMMLPGEEFVFTFLVLYHRLEFPLSSLCDNDAVIAVYLTSLMLTMMLTTVVAIYIHYDE